MGQGSSVFGLRKDDLKMGKKEKPSIKVSREASEKHQMVVNNVYELLECPVCTTIMSPPIFQCPNGHTLCSICKIGAQSCCPICQVDIGSSIRCLALEKVAQTLEIPYECPYHVSECFLMAGSIAELLTHLKDDHNVDIFNAAHNVVILDGFNADHVYVQPLSHEIKKAKGMGVVFRCYGQEFYYQFEEFLVGTTPCYIALLRFMGEDNKAKKFKYFLKIRENGRKLTWEGVPRSIRDSYETVRDSRDGLVIPKNLALSLSHGNEQEFKLRIHLGIRIK